jgi:type IV secretory pathway VirB3-like protein
MNATTLTANLTGYRFAGLDRAAEVAGVANEAAKTLVMLGAAPFIGLAFVVALPFAGLALLAWLAAKALVANHRAFWKRVRNVALFFAAPFIGLAYAVALPFVGFGALVWIGVGAARKRPAAA